MPQLLLDVNQAAEALGISRARLYELMNQGKIRYVHIGRLRKIKVEALRQYVDDLEATSA
jgi:excisionase family DNA binding protein